MRAPGAGDTPPGRATRGVSEQFSRRRPEETPIYAELADRLQTALGVRDAVGVRIVRDESEVASAESAAASCVHWSTVLTGGHAQRTAARDHAACSVGSYVHGMSTLEQAGAGDDTATLVAAGWVEPSALESLPTLEEGSLGIDYLPLREITHEPDLVLLALTPEQLMAVQEAIPALLLTGKPQCQIVPLAAAGTPCASLGCAVSRARTQAAPSQMTCALPTAVLVEAIGALEAAVAADQIVAEAVRES